MSVEGSTLAELRAVVGGRLIGEGAVRVYDVTHDSRQAGPASLFVAIPGERFDGHDFVAGVRAGGVCVEHEMEAPCPQIIVESTRPALGRLASEVHGHPSHAMAVVGITGTNGKTTVTHMLAAIARAAGVTPGIVGTIGARIGENAITMSHTSPEASDLQRLLARMVEAGVGMAALEVSSHALELERMNGTRFAAVAFTNLSQDHLDFHGDIERYYRTKAKLFAEDAPAVVNVDDEYGVRLAAEIDPALRVGIAGDVSARIGRLTLGYAEFALRTPAGETKVALPVGGAFNVQNALVAAGCAFLIGYSLEEIATGLGNLPAIPGRLEPVPTERPFSVFVDYAHTPEAVANVISAARKAAGRVLVVVGAAGDRDRSKRPLIGAAASTADLVFLTSDNPRSEDPAAILAEVVAGAEPAKVWSTVDRRRAIREAFEAAQPGDVVLILGKGHEMGQDFGTEVLPFDDREVAREELARL